MKTACPHCDSLLTLTEEQIQQRQGMVRCGVCRQVFNALEYLVEDDYPVLQEQDDEPVLMPNQSGPASFRSSTVALSSAVPSSASVSIKGGSGSPVSATPSQGMRTAATAQIRSTSSSTVSHTGYETSDAQQMSAHRSHQSEPRTSSASVHASSSAPMSTPMREPAQGHAATPSTAPTAVHIHLNQGTMMSGAHKSSVTHEIGSHASHDSYEDEYYIDQASARRGSKDANFSIQSDSSYEEDYSDYVPSRSGGGGLFWFFLVLVAIALFAGQFMYVFRNQISTILPSSRPLLIQMCGFLKCNLGFSKSIEDLELSQVNVGVDSSLKPNAGEHGLRLQANLLNKGTVASEWPSLILTLKNATGSVSNRKVIEPKQYVLPEMLMQNFQPGAQVLINLPFILSGDAVSNYELGLFFP
ncbi:MAG: zinc-ribbon and DUF3426 domain-containing protein [Pelistega sp.]|nr:zinc-ribbon and DUF3426 domain-containing protein [Pelistega sp.]